MFEASTTHARTPGRALALECLAQGIEAAHPDVVVPRSVTMEDGELSVGETCIDLDRFERINVLGGGNAAGYMAAALERVLSERIDDGVVVTDHPRPTERIRMVKGNHPIPDTEAAAGTEAVHELTRAADEGTLIIALLSGGGSALLPAPVDSVSLSEIQAVTRSLLEAGAPIQELNSVRKHLSRVKGGRLAEVSTPATVVGLLISDVIDDDTGVIASGPLAPDTTTFDDAIAVIERWDITVPEAVRDHLERGRAGEIEETPTDDSPAFDRVTVHVLANNHTALDAARSVATDRGYATTILSAAVSGDAETAGADHAAMARDVRSSGSPVPPPAVILSGGETTVTVDGGGIGGPNHEFAVGAALSLAETPETDAVIASVDTDGLDGNSDGAGGLVDSETVTDADSARRALETNDTAPYLADRDAQLVSGFTGTNVNDLRVVVLSE